MNVPSLLSFLVPSEFYQNVSLALFRIVVAKPHSADVERLISIGNISSSLMIDKILQLKMKTSIYLYIMICSLHGFINNVGS